MRPRTILSYPSAVTLIAWLFSASVSAATFTATVCYEGIENLSAAYVAQDGPHEGGRCISASSADTTSGEGGWTWDGTNYWEDLAWVGFDVYGTPGTGYEFNALWSYELTVSDVQPGESLWLELGIGYEIYSAVGAYSGSKSYSGVIPYSGQTNGGVFEYYIFITSSYSPVTAVPLPGSLVLLLTGAAGLLSTLRRRGLASA